MKVRFFHPSGGTLELTMDDNPRIVGRSGGGADVELDGDTRVSRRHGRLWNERGTTWYEDLGSANGSYCNGNRLTAPVELAPGVTIKLGETTLSLADAAPTDHGAGLTVQMQVNVHGEGAVNALAGGQYAARYLPAFYGFVQALLGSTSQELVPLAFKVIRDVIPAAQRISLVAWPPQADGAMNDLVPHEASPTDASPVSVSLARYAVDTAQALLLAPGAVVGDNPLKIGESVRRHGIRSAVYVPIQGADTSTLGVLCVDTPTPALPFTPDDLQFIRAVGGLLATAIRADLLREDGRQRELQAREADARHEAMVDFLQIASHDLKGPLTVILLAGDVLRKRSASTPGETLANTIVDAARRAQGLIQAYLDVTALASGESLSIEPRDIDVGKMVDEEISFAQQSMTSEYAARYTFTSRVQGLRLHADAQKLRQILANLISNAVKYSPNGGPITVESEARGDALVLHVRDKGMGIAPEDQARLFGEFQRVGDIRGISGTGLGLWLTNVLVRAHGGSISVESALGKGTTFSISFPRTQE